MKKIISLLLSAQTVILLTAAALLFSSCVVVNPEDDAEIFIEKKDKKTKEVSTTSSQPESNPSQNQTYNITFKNRTDLIVTEWFVKKDNTVTFSNSGFTHAIGPHNEDMIMNLAEGYYRIYFILEGESPCEACYRSESIYLDKPVTYLLVATSSNGYTAECRSAENSETGYYLEGSDGSRIEVVRE